MVFSPKKMADIFTGVARPVEKRNWRGDAMVRGGFKEGLQQSQGLVGGL